MSVLIWVAAGVVLAVAEVLTVTLVLAMFSVGAFSGALAAGLGASVPVQIAVFILVSLLSLVAIRPLLRRRLRPAPQPNRGIGMDSLVGSTAAVVAVVNEAAGQVRIDGELWSARAAAARYEPGTRVRVVGVDGATVWVDAAEGEEGER
ncbi:membrane protein [Pilimelia anulata]|uniref:Membrane protein n=1 Tax=Pilimelia anulata TaxID=53371 RepID=A0A8J3B3V9_9ACTN|nr:NfeD family protein [Pilimelia anulata]GGJ81472.1 membrane protein [Pilimelia anulata]